MNTSKRDTDFNFRSGEKIKNEFQDNLETEKIIVPDNEIFEFKDLLQDFKLGYINLFKKVEKIEESNNSF